MKNSAEKQVEAAVSFAVLLAGGSGSRMRGVVRDKCLEDLAGLPVIAHSAKAFLEAGVVGGFVVVCRDEAQRGAIEAAFRLLPAMRGAAAPQVFWAQGGAERQDSVLNGLKACPAGTDLAFVHDTARPLIHPETIRELARVARERGAAVAAHRVNDTIKRHPAEVAIGAPAALEDLDRSTLWAMETPQVFRHALILDALREVNRLGLRVTDDVAAVTHGGHGVAIVESVHPNPKLTTPGDLPLLAHLLNARGAANLAGNPAASRVAESAPVAAGNRAKLCGVTRAEDVRAALAMGVAFIGVNAWAGSPRRVSWEAIPALLAEIPVGKRVYVDVAPDDATLRRAFAVGFDFAQIHFDPTEADSAQRAAAWSAIATPARLWLAPRLAPNAAYPEGLLPLADTFLFDGYKAEAFGGTGRVADVARFCEIRAKFPEKRWILAGGLGPETLPILRRSAPKLFQTETENRGAPSAVSRAVLFDLNSGVETEPGVKSAEKLRRALEALA